MKLLIVEDEHRIAQSIKKGLEQEHYVVDLAYTGTQGYDLSSTEEYDLIVLDLMLPEIDGLTICKHLRETSNHTPILMLTAKGQTEDTIKGLDTGADDYLTKPFAFEELLARIRALIRRPKTLTVDILTVGDLQLDTKTFSITRGNTPIRLSGKEFLLLTYLMHHKNQTLSKDHIISHVWEYNTDILPNTVEAYIRHLREKIDLPFQPKKSLIQTIRGFGYRLGDGKS